MHFIRRALAIKNSILLAIGDPRHDVIVIWSNNRQANTHVRQAVLTNLEGYDQKPSLNSRSVYCKSPVANSKIRTENLDLVT